MSRIDNSALSPEAQSRIDRARQRAKSIVMEGQAEADRVFNDCLETRIDRDMKDRGDAYSLARLGLIESQNSAVDVYFGTIAYEHLQMGRSGAEFWSLLEEIGAEAGAAFQCDPAELTRLKAVWGTRAARRNAIESATSEVAPQIFWLELAAEFAKLDGADLRAELGDNSWWAVCGGPPNLAVRGRLCLNIAELVRRALAKVAFYDRLLAVEVWMDALHRGSPHSSGDGIDHLSIACADYCCEFAKRSTEAVPPTSSRSDMVGARQSSAPADSYFRKQGDFWTMCFAGTTITLSHLKGLSYVADLLRSPRVPIEASVLAGANIESTNFAQVSGLPITDPKAIRAVRADLAEKKEALACLQRADWPRRGVLEEEIRKLKGYLAQVETRQGQPRKVAGTAERSRTAVTNAINRAIEQIAKQHPDLGRHLKDSIKMGTVLIYVPVELPDWRF